MISQLNKVYHAYMHNAIPRGVIAPDQWVIETENNGTHIIQDPSVSMMAIHERFRKFTITRAILRNSRTGLHFERYEK